MVPPWHPSLGASTQTRANQRRSRGLLVTALHAIGNHHIPSCGMQPGPPKGSERLGDVRASEEVRQAGADLGGAAVGARPGVTSATLSERPHPMIDESSGAEHPRYQCDERSSLSVRLG